MPHHLSIDLETFSSEPMPILLTVPLCRWSIWRAGKNFLTGWFPR